MSEAGTGRGRIAWAFTATLPVQHVARARSSGWAAVADGSRNVYILDEAGAVQGEFRAGKDIRQLSAAADGSLFGALAGDGVIYAFDPEGRLDWRAEFDGHVTCFDWDRTGAHLAAGRTRGDVCSYHVESRAKIASQAGWPVESVVVLRIEPFTAAVGGGEGQLALFEGGEQRWQKELGGRGGPVCYAPGEELLVVPAFEDGLLLFGLDGGGVGSIELMEPVCRAAVTGDGVQFLAETVNGGLTLVDRGGAVLWKTEFRRPPSDWAVDGAGESVVVARGGRRVVAYRLAPGEPAEEAEQRKRPDEAEEGAPEPKPGPPQGSVLWERELPAGIAGDALSALRVGRDGDFVAVASAQGTVVVMDAQGELLWEVPVSAPAGVVPLLPEHALCAWAAEEAVLLRPAEGEKRQLSFSPRVRRLECSADLDLVCTIGEDDAVRAFRAGRAWTKSLDPPPTDLWVSPSGQTVMVSDETGRFRYYTADGDLFHKLRFGGSEQYRAWGLADDYSVFASRKGRVTVVDIDGSERWSGGAAGALADVELLGKVFATYSEEQTCAIVYPGSGETWEFWPPPGKARARPRPGADPVLFHARDRTLTAFTGYRRKLEAVWCFEAERAIEAFAVDRGGRLAVVVAGDYIYAIDAATA